MCKNEYSLSEDGKTAYIKLTQGQIAIIDAEDLEKIGAYRWCAAWNKSRKLYVATTTKYTPGKNNKTIYMHRLIMSAKNCEVVDHINGDSLLNKKNNLRICTQAENARNLPKSSRNTSGTKGIVHRDGKWTAYIMMNGKLKHIGNYDYYEEALSARKEYEQKLYGEFVSDREKIIHTRPPKINRLPEKFYSEEYGDVYLVPLNKGLYAIIDLCDYELVSKHVWYAMYCKSTNGYYAVTNMCIDGKRRPVRMHRMITNAPDDKLIDHVNGDGLDERRLNLRECSYAENIRNSKLSKNNKSGFKGVNWSNVMQKWEAKIMVNRKKIHLGYYDAPSEAHESYCAAALKYHKEFANFG